MQLDPAIQILIGLSLSISFFLAISLWRSGLSGKWKIVLTLVVLPPILGPIMYVWIRNFPAKPRQELRGHGAGIGRRFLDAELSRKANSESLYQAIDEELADTKQRKRRS